MLASIEALLLSVVDYAGLFPPAKLDLQQAMVNYARYLNTPYAWMLGRFVLPASRLQEFTELVQTFPPEEKKQRQWSLSVIFSQNIESELEKVRSLNILNKSNAIAVTSFEFPPLPPTQIKEIISRLPQEVDSFFEIPLSGDLQTYLNVLRHTHAAAKLRTGGVTVDAFPSVTQLCQCIFALAEAQISFKATAGLHHPLPGKHALTSEPDSPTTVMHGFLNVALLTAFIYWQKVTPLEGLELLKESSKEALQFTTDSIAWRNHQLNIAQIEETRQRFFSSFGSCSFQEPIDDLKQLQLLS